MINSVMETHLFMSVFRRGVKLFPRHPTALENSKERLEALRVPASSSPDVRQAAKAYLLRFLIDIKQMYRDLIEEEWDSWGYITQST